MEFPRQEYWSGLLFPSPGDISHPRIEPASPALASGFFTTESPGKPLLAIILELSKQESRSSAGNNQEAEQAGGKEYVKAVYCHPAYLPSMQTIS